MVLVHLLQDNMPTKVWPIEFYGLSLVLPDGQIRNFSDEEPGRKHGELPISDADSQRIQADLSMGWVNGWVGRYSWTVSEYHN